MESDNNQPSGPQLLKARSEKIDDLRSGMHIRCMYDRCHKNMVLVRGRIYAEEIRDEYYDFFETNSRANADLVTQELIKRIHNRVHAVSLDNYGVSLPEFREDACAEQHMSDVVFQLSRKNPTMRGKINESLHRGRVKRRVETGKHDPLMPLDTFMQLHDPYEKIQYTRNLLIGIVGDVVYLRCINSSENFQNVLEGMEEDPNAW